MQMDYQDDYGYGDTGAPSGGPSDYPSDSPPPGHHWEWGNGGWQAVPDAVGTPTDPEPQEPLDPPDPAPTPPPAPGPSGGTLSSLLTAYPGQFTPPAYGAAWDQVSAKLGPVPQLRKVDLPQIDPFTAPTWQSIGEDPGYQFRVKQGEQALMNNKAAQGLTRSGATLKDLLGYNQNFASNEYGNVFDRNLTGWRTNADTKLQLFDRDLGSARAELEPQLYGWQQKGQFGQAAERDAWNNSYKQFQDDYTMWRNNQNDWLDAAQWDLDFGRDTAAL